MKTVKQIIGGLKLLSLVAIAVSMLAGCQSSSSTQNSQGAASTVVFTETKPALPSVRIKTGVSDGFTDSHGNKWLPDQGFADGETVDRPDVAIVGTSDPEIYRAERYSMTHFTQPLPNGSYVVKLHFCETFEGITGPGQRVFSFNVAGHEFKDFDVWAKSGGFLHAYVETVPVDVTNGKLEIIFTPNIENPQINGVEIVPAK